jgi:hypothetical protein
MVKVIAIQEDLMEDRQIDSKPMNEDEFHMPSGLLLEINGKTQLRYITTADGNRVVLRASLHKFASEGTDDP